MKLDPQHHTTVTNSPNAVATTTLTVAPSPALGGARKYVYRYADSSSRMDAILAFKTRLNRADWLTLFGEIWSGCDNNSEYYSQLRRILKTAGP